MANADTNANPGDKVRIIGDELREAFTALTECLATRAAFDDVQTFQGETLKPAATSFFNFMSDRDGNANKVRVLNVTGHQSLGYGESVERFLLKTLSFD